MFWSAVSLRRRDLLFGCRRSWFGSAAAFNADFFAGCYYPRRLRLAGGNQYADQNVFFVYPRMVMRVFAWCGWVTQRQAGVIFSVGLGAHRGRRHLGRFARDAASH